MRDQLTKGRAAKGNLENMVAKLRIEKEQKLHGGASAQELLNAQYPTPAKVFDSKGGDDYYNEKGVFLYSDTKTSNNIKLITQAQFDKIHRDFKTQMADTDNSYGDLINRLESESKLITVKIDASQFQNMLDDSNLDSNKSALSYPDRRKETAAAIILDIENAEIRLQRFNDKSNVFDGAKMNEISANPNKDGTYLWWSKEKGVDPNMLIIAVAHTHPYNGKGDILFGGLISHDPTKPIHGDLDNPLSSELGGANYQIYPPNSENQVDKAYRYKLGMNNFMPTNFLLNSNNEGVLNLVKDAIKTFGKSPRRKQNKQRYLH